MAMARSPRRPSFYARCIARVDRYGWRKWAHLIRRSYLIRTGEQKAMQVAAWERSTLYGIVVNPKKRVNFGPMKPAGAREIFIRQNLVGGEINEDLRGAGRSGSTTRS